MRINYDVLSLLANASISMMAPGLPEIAHAFNITNPTIAALTLSIFLLAYVSALSYCTILPSDSILGIGASYNKPAFRRYIPSIGPLPIIYTLPFQSTAAHGYSTSATSSS